MAGVRGAAWRTRAGLAAGALRRRTGLSCRTGVCRALAGWLLGWAALALLPATADGQIPPDEDWRTLETEHFRVTYPAQLRDLATRAADRAERAWTGLARSLPEPSTPVDVVIVDHVDFSNGFANVVPSNRITIYARPPVDGRSLGYFDDWMELVVTHEVAHIFHLDRTRRLGRLVRAVVGRYPGTWPFFPGRATPTWVTEGIATYYESALTESGRVRGTWQEMVLRTAALEDRLERLDQVSGDSPVWPAGLRPYAYGSEFLEALLSDGDPGPVADFVDAVAGQIIPFRIDAAARNAFGISFSEAWREWTRQQRARYAALADSLAELRPLTRSERLTRGARFAVHPRVSPDGGSLAYVRVDGRSDSQVRIRDLATSRERSLTRTNGAATMSWSPAGRLVLTQYDFDGPYRIWSDVYRADAGGGVARVTRGARVVFPDVHPDGRRAVAVQEGGGSNRLVEVDLESGEVRPLREARDDEHWSFPRWSPDGRWIAAARWRAGGRLDVVLLDGAGRLVRQVTDDRAVDIMPTWSPDGRQLLWSSDRTGIANLFAVAVDAGGETGPVRQVTHVLTGAAYPAVDPEGRWIYYSEYHHDGWDLARVPYAPGRWASPLPTDSRFLSGGERSARSYSDRIEAEERPYRAFRTLRPTYWEPIFQEARPTLGREVVGPAFGIATSGNDLVGRHSVAGWVRVAPSDGKMEGRLGYGFAGLGNPVVDFATSQLWSRGGARLGERSDGTTDTLLVVERERGLDVNVRLRRRTFRTFTGLTLSAGHAWVRSELLDLSLEPSTLYSLARPTRRVGVGAATLSFSTARSHAMSVSAENGVSGFVRGRIERVLDLPAELAGDPGADDASEEVAAQLALYKSLGGPGFARHVVALRVSGGAAQGPGADGFHFEVGGAAGRSERITGFSIFGGTPLLFPVRGYPRLSRRGRFAWSASAEYRVPLFLVRRGLGAWPLYLDRTSASAFVDVGNAWGPTSGGIFPSPRLETLASAGVEVTVVAQPLWANTLSLRVGVGMPLVARDAESGVDGPRVYVRLGVAF